MEVPARGRPGRFVEMLNRLRGAEVDGGYPTEEVEGFLVGRGPEANALRVTLGEGTDMVAIQDDLERLVLEMDTEGLTIYTSVPARDTNAISTLQRLGFDLAPEGGDPRRGLAVLRRESTAPAPTPRVPREGPFLRKSLLELGESMSARETLVGRREALMRQVDEFLAEGDAHAARAHAITGREGTISVRQPRAEGAPDYKAMGKARPTYERPAHAKTPFGEVVTGRGVVGEKANIAAFQENLVAKQASVEESKKVIEVMRARRAQIEANLLLNEVLANDAKNAVIRELDQATGLYEFGKFGGLDEAARLGDIDPDDLIRMLNEEVHMWGPWMIADGGPEFHKTVWDAMMASMYSGNRAEVTGFTKTYDKLHNWIKANLIATPGFVLRNVMGGAFNMWFDGIPPSEILNGLRLISKANNLGGGDIVLGAARLVKQAKGKPMNVYGKTFGRRELDNFKTLIDGGAAHGGQAASAVEQRLINRTRLAVTARLKTGGEAGERIGTPIVLDPRNANFFYFRAIREANSIAEEGMRVGTGLFAMREGGTLDDALARVYKLHFDYSDLADWEVKWGKRVFPFYTWSRNNLPLQVQFLAKNPQRFNRLFDLKRNLEWGEDKEGEGYVPDFYLEPFGVKLPFKIGGSKVFSVPDWPFQDLFRLDPSAEGMGAMSNLLSMSSPLIKAPIEYWAGKTVFGNIPYTGRMQQVPKGFKTVPFLLNALQMVGLAERSTRTGEWSMSDKNIALVAQGLPFLNLMRRAMGDERRYQDKTVQIWASLLGGQSVRVLTPRVQVGEQMRREIERNRHQRDRRDIEFGRRM